MTNRESGKITTNSQIAGQIKTVVNLDDTAITITQSKLKVILMECLHKLQPPRSWEAALAVFLTILLVFLTTDFNKDFLNIPRETWQALFILGFIFSFAWLYSSLFRYFRYNVLSIDELITLIKNEEEHERR